MAIIPPANKQWYVVHVLSGLKNNAFVTCVSCVLVEAEEMGDFIYEVLVPQEIISEVKRGKKTESKRKILPRLPSS